MWIFTFLGTPLGKVVGIIAGLVMLAGVAWTALAIHDHEIRKLALLEFNKAQMEQVLKEQQEFTKKMDLNNELQKSILEAQKKQQEALAKKFEPLDQWLESDEARKQDRPSSEILKRTLRELQGISK